MKRFTYDDYVDAMAEAAGLADEYMSEKWKTASRKASSILEALLWQDETRADAVMELRDDVMTLRMTGTPEDDHQIRHEIWLLEQAEAHDALDFLAKMEKN